MKLGQRISLPCRCQTYHKAWKLPLCCNRCPVMATVGIVSLIHDIFVSIQADDDEEEEDGDDDDAFDDEEDAPIARRSKEHRESKKGSKSTFSNALLRAGTKSTKDATLDKPVRKMPGLLLEAAGRSLMQKRASAEDGSGEAAKPVGISFGLASTKISFGLYEGHLPIDHASYTKSSGDSESDSDRNDTNRGSESIASTDSGAGTISVLGGASTKKVFSNWGGEFFKKNLDYRANTNKILEKMNLNLSVGSNNSGNASAATTKTSNGDSAVADRFKSSLIGGPKLGLTGSAGLKRPSVDSISSNEASPAKKFFNSYA